MIFPVVLVDDLRRFWPVTFSATKPAKMVASVLVTAVTMAFHTLLKNPGFFFSLAFYF